MQAQSAVARRTLRVETTDLTIAIEDAGDPRGFPIILLHGFPDDVRAWDDVVPLFLPRENPPAVAQAILDGLNATR